MVKDNLVRLNHMLDAANAIEQFMKNRTREELESDLMLFSALIRQLEIFGEAASGISQDCREGYGNIPWSKIVGMRNRLIHAYFDVDPEIVWQAITVELPSVIAELKKMVKNLS